MFTMEISVHIDSHSIVVLGISSMVCVRGQQQCRLQPMCRLSGSLVARIRGKPGLLSCSTITRRSLDHNATLPSCLPHCHWASSLDHLLDTGRIQIWSKLMNTFSPWGHISCHHDACALQDIIFSLSTGHHEFKHGTKRYSYTLLKLRCQNTSGALSSPGYWKQPLIFLITRIAKKRQPVFCIYAWGVPL